MKLHIARRQCLVSLGAGLLAPRAAWSGTEQAGPLDLMPAFWAVYDAGQGQPVEARARRLSESFFLPHAADYKRAGNSAALDAAKVARWLPVFDKMAPEVRAVSAEFPRIYALQVAKFRQALPDFDLSGSPVAFLPSLLYFDAHLEPGAGQLPLFFAPDGIVKYHGASADLDVLFSHEMFHCYQGQKNPAMSLDSHPPVFANLWIEGTATYASERLNPGASLLHVLLDDPQLAAADAKTLRAAGRALLDHLDSTDDALLESFFSAGYRGPDWPARAGYDVGLRVARKVGEHLTLPAIASMPTPQVREAVAQVLREMAA